MKEKTVPMMHLQHLTLLMWHLNSVINPFIYAFRMPKLQAAFGKLLHFRSNDVGPTPIDILGVVG